jgi:DNA-damage-inducible protein J
MAAREGGHLHLGAAADADRPFLRHLVLFPVCGTTVATESAMAKSEMIRARVEPELKHKAESVLENLGMTPTEAITLFYKQITLYRGLPFPVRIPNAATRKALQDARTGKDIERFDSVSAWAERVR